jgi:uncharacterized protein
MRLGVSKSLVTCLLLAGWALSVFAQGDANWSLNRSPLPPPTGFVNDYAGVIDAATKQQLEEKLRNLRDTTDPPVEIAVAIVKTTGDRPIFDYSLAVARGWGIGSKADDNPSALLFIAINDRKYFTQVSKDLEDELPDGVVGSLQRQYLVPEFRKGNYGKGISDTIDAYINVIRGEGNVAAPAEQPSAGGPAEDDNFYLFFCFVLVIFIAIVAISSAMGRRKSGSDHDRWGGGFGSSGGGNSVADALPWIIGGIISSASDSSSSSDWGGSSGWGGFGGGGDFGGGGAGGDW